MSGLLFLICMMLAFPKLVGRWLAEVRIAYEAKIDPSRSALKEASDGE